MGLDTLSIFTGKTEERAFELGFKIEKYHYSLKEQITMLLAHTGAHEYCKKCGIIFFLQMCFLIKNKKHIFDSYRNSSQKKNNIYKTKLIRTPKPVYIPT